ALAMPSSPRRLTPTNSFLSPSRSRAHTSIFVRFTRRWSPRLSSRMQRISRRKWARCTNASQTQQAPPRAGPLFPGGPAPPPYRDECPMFSRILGSGAPAEADANLILQVAMGAALLAGALLARMKRYKPHAICQTAVLLINAVAIAWM